MSRIFSSSASAEKAGLATFDTLEGSHRWELEIREHGPAEYCYHLTLFHEEGPFLDVWETDVGEFVAKARHPTLRKAVLFISAKTAPKAVDALLNAAQEYIHALRNELSATALMMKADAQVYRQCKRARKEVLPRITHQESPNGQRQRPSNLRGTRTVQAGEPG